MDIFKMAKLKMHSNDWFDAAFEGVNQPDSIKRAARRICVAYGITGQSDPGYIANVIGDALSKRA